MAEIYVAYVICWLFRSLPHSTIVGKPKKNPLSEKKP